MAGFFVIFAGMKAKLFVIGILLLALNACHTPTHEAKRMVHQAKQLADTLPDSTLRLIDNVLHIPVNFSERERMDLALLQAEVLFNNAALDDNDFLDTIATSPELERAAAYYSKKKQYAKAALAAFYSGRVQQHYNEKDVAILSFKEAEHYGELAGDSLTMARSKYKIAKYLLDDGRKQEAFDMLKNAEKGLRDYDAEKALVQNMMAVCKMLQGDFENAEICIQIGLAYAVKCHSNKLKRKILNNMAVLYRQQKKYDQAVACLQQIAKDPELEETKMLLLNLNLGNLYFDDKRMDSAALYYRKVNELLPISKVKLETQLAANDALLKFAKYQNNDSLAFHYREEHEGLLFNIMNQRQEQNVYRIKQQYDYQTLQNSMNRIIIQRQRIISIISILLLFSTLIILAFQYRHKQLLKEEKEMKQQIEKMKLDLLQSVKVSVLEKEVDLRLRLIISATRTANRANDYKKEWQPLVKQILNGEESVFEAACDVIEMAYPGLYATILEQYPYLNETEAKVCLMSCSNLSNTEIAEILGLKLNTVNQSRSTLRKKMNLKPERLKEQLRNAFSEKK